MRKRIVTAANTYSKAKTVAVLWVLSMMLPVAMIPVKKWNFSPINFGAFAVFVVLLFFLVRFVRRRISEQTWGRSDSVVYVLVPLALFFAYFSLMLTPVVR